MAEGGVGGDWRGVGGGVAVSLLRGMIQDSCRQQAE